MAGGGHDALSLFVLSRFEQAFQFKQDQQVLGAAGPFFA